MLLRIGFKEIDVSFPSASDTEYNFTRSLIEQHAHMIPSDVWLQVLSPCKKEHIRRTVDSVRGAPNVIISLYIAASDMFLSTVFNMSQDEVLRTAVDCVTYAREISKDDPAHKTTNWNLMFSPEAFSDTDAAFSARLCAAVQQAWRPTSEIPIILNLPATVEMASPNVYADQVELFCRSLTDPDKVVVSLHPHNDRGCAVAAAELGVMAGARRVEGCLFGNGERTGNVDLVTLALNLYSQGIDPGLDFSDLKSVKAIYEECTRIKVPLRLPYSGDAVFIAYSGSHQDAINKAFRKMERHNTSSLSSSSYSSSSSSSCSSSSSSSIVSTLREEAKHVASRWKVPYLPIDPTDIGSTYESVIRLNSQSGSGGISWTLARELSLDLPKPLQLAFSKVIKSASEKWNRTLYPSETADLFLRTYGALGGDPRIGQLRCRDLSGVGTKGVKVEAVLYVGGGGDGGVRVEGKGADVLSAVENAFEGRGVGELKFGLNQRTLVLGGGGGAAMGGTGMGGVGGGLVGNGGGVLKGIAIVECTARNGKVAWGASLELDPDVRVWGACLTAALVCSLCSLFFPFFWGQIFWTWKREGCSENIYFAVPEG